MATEYKLSYTASEIDEKLGKVDENATNISQLSETVNDLNKKGGGQPTPVTLASEMTDTTKLYLYVGSEDGYSNGHFYYYNGTSWVSGGKYGGEAIGWTTEQIDLFDSLLNYIPFKDAVAGTIADLLVASLRKNSGGTTDEPVAEMYTITRTLENCTSSSEIASIVEGVSHSETFAPNDGYTLDGAEITVTMGGADISSSYADGVLSIGSVTGNIEITVKAKEMSYVLYELPQATTFDGTKATCIDTGVALFDEDKDWSIVVDMETISGGQFSLYGKIFSVNDNNNYPYLTAPVNNNPRVYYFGSYATFGSSVWVGEKTGNTMKCVVTHIAESGVVNVCADMTDVAGKSHDNVTGTTPVATFTALTDNVELGNRSGFSFKTNDFKIYSRVLTDDEISAYLA